MVKGKKPKKQLTGSIVGSDKQSIFAKFSKKTWLIFGGILILLVVTTIGLVTKSYLDREKPKEQKAVAVVVCDEKLITEASKSMAPEKYKQLKKVVDKIMQLPNYEKDPNCLYPVVVYYVNFHDETNAEMYYKKLAVVYDEKQGFSDHFGKYYAKLKDLQERLSGLQQFNAQRESNAMYSN